ncbi:MAG TPA: hypothetical protein VMC08_05790, partial [Bacteroidales bacterium]|nr:hypothetical protein [Bacteroidales bacterium]
VQTLNEKIAGVEDRITNAENDLAKLTKIKLSGYIQAQWQYYENSSAYPYNYFSIRRARIKFQYEPTTGVCFVLQPDLSPGNFALKDAYVQLNEPWLKTFSLWIGQFNRPNYEVEYSSSNREVAERSRVILALYPSEREIGAKLEIAPPKVPLLFQLAVLNGNNGLVIKDATGTNINPVNKDFDPYKDVMARFVYTFKLGNFGALDLGVNGYFGYLKATSDTVLKSDYTFDKKVSVGKALNRSWVGGELRLYMDVLGGLSIKSEWMAGVNAYPGFSATASVTNPTTSTITGDTLTLAGLTTKTTSYLPDIRRNFMGGYVYIIKNIGKHHQIAVRWDYYDPNTKIKGDQIGVTKYGGSYATSTTTSSTIAGSPTIIQTNTTKTATNTTYKSGIDDIAYNTFSFAYTYFITDNIKIMLNYDLPLNEKVGKDAKTNIGNVTQNYTVNNVAGTNDFSNHVKQGLLTLRFQVKF